MKYTLMHKNIAVTDVEIDEGLGVITNISITWEAVNFFDNDFSDDIGDVLFGTNTKDAGFDFLSPDNTTDGNLQKRWKIIDGKRCLLKSGSDPYSQQPFNEVIAAIIMKRLGIDHVPYTVS